MRSTYLRVTSGVAYACAFFAVAAIAIGVLGIVGVHRAVDADKAIARDELTTARITAEVGQRMDAAYATGLELALTGDPSRRAVLASTVTNQELPLVESALADLRQIHSADDAAELADIATFGRQWVAVRTVLNSIALSAGAVPALTDDLQHAHASTASHIHALVEREDVDARAGEQKATAQSNSISRVIIGAVVLAALAAVALTIAVGRRVRRAVEPAEDQVEFADTLQLAGNEDEANQLLQQHLERAVAGSSVVVLNRNNSADRLEAANQLPPDSPLRESLTHAEPRSCLAVRSGRAHDQSAHRRALLGCPVCSGCPGHSTCTPLTVGGQVIGSVLVNRTSPYQDLDRERVRESVGQAAPVLANLRNLAIAELRAATDSLTGLPNKRAVGDTLKRMVAQASRTLNPLSLLVIDLDHFKDVNDRFGHPVGDQALANVGAALRAVLRDGDFAGRNGGEEFAVLLPDTDVDGAQAVAENIRAAVADITLVGLEVRLTTSVGVACYPYHGSTSEKLERLADAALYVAKRTGRDRVEVAGPTAETSEILALTQELDPLRF